MPEAVTRDIVQPVKHSTEGFPDAIKEIENIIVEEQLIPKMYPSTKEELLYFTQDEFTNRIKIDGERQNLPDGKLPNEYNSDDFFPLDGEIIKLSDNIAALLEADQSIAHGITSENLRSGRSRILDSCRKHNKVSGINVKPFFSEFKK